MADRLPHLCSDQPTSFHYYYFYYLSFYYYYFYSYWSANLPRLLLLLLFLLLFLLLLQLILSPDRPTIPRSHRPSFLLSSHYIVPCTSYRWSITSCHHCIVSSPYIITYPASHRWVLKLSILSQYHTHWVVMHVSKLAEIKIKIKINDIYLNITHIGMGRFVMHASRLTTW